MLLRRQYANGDIISLVTTSLSSLITKSLKDLICQVIQTSEHQHYLAKLLGYNYSIQYRPGSDNVTMDALCIDVTLGHNFSLSIPHFQFLDRLC